LKLTTNLQKARIWAPNVIALVVSALLQDRASASTWCVFERTVDERSTLIVFRSVAAKSLYRSQWPEFLRSDSALNRGVRKDILLLTKLMGFLGIMIGIAGIVTPLGLYQALLPGPQVQVHFRNLVDTSAFGYGTPPRSSLSFNRKCSRGSGLMGLLLPLPTLSFEANLH